MKKTLKTRLLALLLCLGLCFSSGCGASVAGALKNGVGNALEAAAAARPSPTADAEPQPTEGGGKGEPAPAPSTVRETSFFQRQEHADIDFSEMEYEHYDYSRFQKLLDAISKFTGSGGDGGDFQALNDDVLEELNYIYTLSVLMDILYTKAQTDYTQEESLYITQTYYDANNAWWAAMHELTVSPNGALLEGCYEDWQISWLSDYDDSASGEISRLSLRETELVQEYYDLMDSAFVDYDAVAEVYIELVELRRQIAESSGYASYAEYAFDSVYCRDYSPDDSTALWALVKEYFVPLMQEYSMRLYASSYYPGSLDCSQEAILSAMETVLPQISSELYEAFSYMQSHGLYDIGPDSGKLEVGYTTYLYSYSLPYIINNPGDSYYDYGTMFHEFGHFANMFYTESDLLFGVADNDLCELNSQGLEVLFINFYDQIFGERDSEVIAGYTLLNLLYSIVDGCLYDEFQQRVYREKDLTPQKLRNIYAEIYESYGYSEYEGFENEWADVPHNFEYPFYYISYAVSAVSALELYAMSRRSFEEAADTYLSVTAMNTEDCYFSEALKSAGLGDVFDESTCRDIAAALENEF